MQTAMITGATSGIGVALTEECLRNGCRVIAFIRENSVNRNRLPQSSQVQVIECGLSGIANLKPGFTVEDAVFYHLAWDGTRRKDRDRPERQYRNIQYTLDAISFAKKIGCKKFVGAGSQAEYGIHKGLKTAPDTPASPVTSYGICKCAAGRLGAVLAEQLNIDYFWVRVFSVYGRYDMRDSMLRSAIEKMAAGERCSFTEGTHSWDYLYSADAGKAFYAIGERATGNKVYCLGSGQARPLREYICEVRSLVRPEIEPGFGDIPYNEKNRFSMCADIGSLQKDTGWEPQTDFKTGIQRMAKSLLQARVEK